MGRITLDWDNTYTKTLFLKLRVVLSMFPDNKIEIQKSFSKKGFHVIIYDTNFDFWEEIAIRNILFDDRKRMFKDIQRHKLGIPTNVLFDKKLLINTKNMKPKAL